MRLYLRQWYSPFDLGWKLCAYQTKGNPDFLSQKFYDFKNGIPAAIEAWKSWSIDHLKTKQVKQHDINYCVRALGKSEVFANNFKPLHKLGEALSQEFDFEFIPEIFRKKRVTKDLKVLNRDERYSELDGVFYLDQTKLPNLKNKNVLFVDDIHTSGATTNTMMNVLKKQFAGVKCYLFVLGKTNDGGNNEEIFNKYKGFDNCKF